MNDTDKAIRDFANKLANYWLLSLVIVGLIGWAIGKFV